MERIVEVVPEAGLHARPASKFVQTANRFDSEITVGRADGDDTVSASSMLAVTGLNIEHGERVRITAEGDDAEAALDELEALLTTPVEEDDESEAGDDA
ncbi:HPr family phosphocarrier protein [Halonotius terrestris]|uniref:HPr family phosphocarrier protein n=1 Tax=Halonotius terrestris TaxID=2487750 RepID=A0A8J8PEH9_9EURY|nr:phosphocarrier protein HPr [Halonotius terrestris]TQQ83825.1 HPr family phosphocarrier protein [Halonotius terrestris]